MDAAATISLARQRSGLSLRGLAARAETSHSAIAQYEAGVKEPSVATLNRLVRAAGFATDIRLHRRADGAPGELDRGEELAAVLELAAAFPARHDPDLRFPVYGR